jgi:DNA-directed RNA polymerase specialized sigma24 family protein
MTTKLVNRDKALEPIEGLSREMQIAALMWTVFRAEKASLYRRLYRRGGESILSPEVLEEISRSAAADAWEEVLPGLMLEDELRRYADALDGEPADTRAAVLLHDFARLPHPEIASLLGKSDAAVRQAYSRFMRRIKA